MPAEAEGEAIPLISVAHPALQLREVRGPGGRQRARANLSERRGRRLGQLLDRRSLGAAHEPVTATIPRVRLYQNETNVGMAATSTGCSSSARPVRDVPVADDFLLPPHLTRLEAGSQAIPGSTSSTATRTSRARRRRLRDAARCRASFPSTSPTGAAEWSTSSPRVCPVRFPCALFKREVCSSRESAATGQRASRRAAMGADHPLALEGNGSPTSRRPAW